MSHSHWQACWHMKALCSGQLSFSLVIQDHLCDSTRSQLSSPPTAVALEKLSIANRSLQAHSSHPGGLQIAQTCVWLSRGGPPGLRPCCCLEDSSVHAKVTVTSKEWGFNAQKWQRKSSNGVTSVTGLLLHKARQLMPSRVQTPQFSLKPRNSIDHVSDDTSLSSTLLLHSGVTVPCLVHVLQDRPGAKAGAFTYWPGFSPVQTFSFPSVKNGMAVKWLWRLNTSMLHNSYNTPRIANTMLNMCPITFLRGLQVVGETEWPVKCLPCKYKNLNFTLAGLELIPPHPNPSHSA